MVTTISHLQDQYGSIQEYCKTVGLTTEEIQQIRHNLMQVYLLKFLKLSKFPREEVEMVSMKRSVQKRRYWM